jgi:4-hydroxy 2-oxovalerate aldolase
MAKKSFKILDCTIRDGGYYNNWNFSQLFSFDYFRAVNNTGIDIVEAGYKSLNNVGTFKNIEDKELANILPEKRTYELAFMIDLKEFIRDDGFLEEKVLSNLLKGSSDLFSICRVAITEKEMNFLEPTFDILRSEGLRPIVNLMKTMYVSVEDKTRFFNICNKISPEAVYIADSFGCMLPSDMSQQVKDFSSNYNVIGVHTHDNLGLAFANTLQAIHDGATIVDTTFFGMGRGVGNAKTEQLLSYYEDSGITKITPTCRTFMSIHMLPLQEEYCWGFNLEYMFCGLHDIHPMYCQRLLKDFGKERAAKVLREISHSEKKSKFTEQNYRDFIR